MFCQAISKHSNLNRFIFTERSSKTTRGRQLQGSAGGCPGKGAVHPETVGQAVGGGLQLRAEHGPARQRKRSFRHAH